MSLLGGTLTARARALRFAIASASALLGLAAAPDAALADGPPATQGGIQLSGSGFYTVTAAKSLRTNLEAKEYSLRCACFVSEYAQGGVYEDGRIGWLGDTKLGLQGRAATADGRWSVTGQAVARGARDGRVNLEWLYLTHELDGHWSLQAGRKRLPLLSLSDVQDVGLAYPWVRLPVQLYGWDIVNYNGANVRWRGSWNALALSVNAYAGSETVKDSPFEALYSTDGTRTDTRWSGIRGVELELGWRDIKFRTAALDARASHRYTFPAYPDEPQGFWSDKVPLRIATAALAAEPGPWSFHAEYFYGDRRQEYGQDKGWSLSAGRRFGDLQLAVMRSRYRQIPNELAYTVEASSQDSVLLRWDVAPGRAWKVQLDDFRDHSPNVSVGSRLMLSLSFSGTF